MSGYSTLAQPLETFLLTRVLATSSLSNSPNFNAIKLTLARILDDFNAWILDHTLFVGIQLAVRPAVQLSACARSYCSLY